MKNLGLKVATIVCGGLAVMNGLLALLGLVCFIFDMCLFFTVPTLIFGIPAIKLAKKLGWIKPKVKVNKVKEEKVNAQESVTVEPMFAFNENKSIEPTFETIEEKPVEEKVINIKDFRKENPKEEKNAKEKVKKEKPAKDNMNWLDKWSAKIEEGNWFAIIGILLFWVVIIVGGIALAIWLIGVLISGIGAVIGFLFNAAMYIIGLVLFIWIAGAFLRYWWFLVRWEHCKHPVRRRRW